MFCSNCRAGIPDTAKVCGHCGTPTHTGAAVPAPPPPPTPTAPSPSPGPSGPRWGVIAGISAAMAAVAGAVAITLVVTGDGGTEASTTSTGAPSAIPTSSPVATSADASGLAGFVTPAPAGTCAGMPAEVAAGFQQWVDAAARFPTDAQRRWVDDFEAPPGAEQFSRDLEAWGESLGDRSEALGCTVEVFAQAASMVTRSGPVYDLLVSMAADAPPSSDAAPTTTYRTTLAVPDLTGMRLADAAAEAAGAGLDLVEGGDVPLESGDPSIGLVVHTDPPAGTVVAADDTAVWAQVGIDAGTWLHVHPHDLVDVDCQPSTDTSPLPESVEYFVGGLGSSRLACTGLATVPADTPLFLWEVWVQATYPDTDAGDYVLFVVDGESHPLEGFADWDGGMWWSSGFTVIPNGLAEGEHQIMTYWLVDDTIGLLSIATVVAQ